MDRIRFICPEFRSDLLDMDPVVKNIIKICYILKILEIENSPISTYMGYVEALIHTVRSELKNEYRRSNFQPELLEEK